MNTNRSAEIAKAREVDTEVARLFGEYYSLSDKLGRIFDEINRDQKSMDRYIELDLQIQAARFRGMIEVNKAKAAILRPQVSAALKAAQDFDKANYEGWQRFFLVKHIHSNRYCSSFRDTTRVGWLPNVSGLTEAEAVAEHGATLCTICFPSAPVELTTKQADPNACEGSGQGYSKEYKTGREHAYYGAAGYCPVCLRWQSVTKTGAMRKHKKNDETRRHAQDPR